MLEQEGFILCLHMSFLKVHVTALGAPLTFFRSGAKSPFSLFFFFFFSVWLGGFVWLGVFYHAVLKVQLGISMKPLSFL